MHLRPLEIEDLDILYEIENESEDWKYSRSTVPYSRSVLKEYIENQRADIYLDGQVRFVIVENNEVKGMVDLVNFEPRDLRAEVCIAVRKKYRGNGVAKRAIEKLIEYSHKFLMIEQLFAVVNEHNLPSVKLFENLGFERSGFLKEWFRTFDGRENAFLFQLFLKKD